VIGDHIFSKEAMRLSHCKKKEEEEAQKNKGKNTEAFIVESKRFIQIMSFWPFFLSSFAVCAWASPLF